MSYEEWKKTPFAKAVKDFEAVQEEYADFGASDTEPRCVFKLYIEAIVDSAYWGKEERPLPRTINDWQIFGPDLDKRFVGAGKVARALTKAAKEAGKQARKDIKAAAWYDLNY